MPDKEINFLISEARKLGTDKFIYKYWPSHGDEARFAAFQAELAESADYKLPTFSGNNCFYTRRGLEQSTSEEVAKYKASLFKGSKLLVLAGGLGVDDWAFSKSFEQVVSVDPDASLNGLVRDNFVKLGSNNIKRLDLTAEEFMASNHEIFDTVYADPDRRDEGKRQFMLGETKPNIIALTPLVFKFSPLLLVKCSPLYDHEMALREMEGISNIYIISLNGEVKEMLLQVHSKPSGSTAIHCTDISKGDIKTCSFSSLSKDIPPTTDNVSGYFCEAGASVVKVRKHHEYAALKQLKLLDSSVPFYVSDIIPADFIGRSLSIVESFPFSAAKCKKYLSANHINQANIKVRGLGYQSVSLYIKLAIKEGGEDFLFMFPYKGEAYCAHCRY